MANDYATKADSMLSDSLLDISFHTHATTYVNKKASTDYLSPSSVSNLAFGTNKKFWEKGAFWAGLTVPLIVPLLLLCCRYIKWDCKAFFAGLVVCLSITAAIVIGTGGVGAILSALELSSGVCSIEALSALGIALWGSGAGMLLIVLVVGVYALLHRENKYLLDHMV